MSHDLTVSAPQGIYLTGLDTPYKAFVGGFGSGKTFVGCLDTCIMVGRHPGIVQGYFAPTYRDIKDTYYPTMDEAAHGLGFRTLVKSADKEVDLYRGRAYYGTVKCRSMEDPNAIVGFKVARAHIDEIDILPMEKATNAWRKIAARLRDISIPGVVNGAGVTTTPEGFRFVYETFAVSPTARYSMVQASTYENERFLPPGYIDGLKETYPDELIAAYLNGDFVNLTSGTVYRCFDRRRNASTETMRTSEPLFLGMDFNVGNMSVKVFVKRENGWHMVSEIDGGRDTPSVIDTIRERYAGHHITVYPDASGKNTSSKGASLSDVGLLRQAGFTIRAKDSNPKVKDRVLAVNKAFERQQVWVNVTACPVAAKCLEQQAYDKNGEPDKNTGHDHSNDATGYPIAYEFPVVKPIARVGRIPFL